MGAIITAVGGESEIIISDEFKNNLKQ